SVTPAWIGHHIRPGRIAVVAAAVREPVTLARCGGGAGEAADYGARSRTAGAAGDQTAEHTADDGAAYAGRAGIRRRWRRRWIGARRRRIGAGHRRRTGV